MREGGLAEVAGQAKRLLGYVGQSRHWDLYSAIHTLNYATHTPRVAGGQKLDEFVTAHFSETGREEPPNKAVYHEVQLLPAREST